MKILLVKFESENLDLIEILAIKKSTVGILAKAFSVARNMKLNQTG